MESIEQMIDFNNKMAHCDYYYCKPELEPDVEKDLNDLRRRCRDQLRKNATFSLECYEKRKNKGEPLHEIEWIRRQANIDLGKANGIQMRLDLFEANKQMKERQKEREQDIEEEGELIGRVLVLISIVIIVLKILSTL